MGDIRTSARVTVYTFKHICSLQLAHRLKGVSLVCILNPEAFFAVTRLLTFLFRRVSLDPLWVWRPKPWGYNVYSNKMCVRVCLCVLQSPARKIAASSLTQRTSPSSTNASMATRSRLVVFGAQRSTSLSKDAASFPGENNVLGSGVSPQEKNERGVRRREVTRTRSQ